MQLNFFKVAWDHAHAAKLRWLPFPVEISNSLELFHNLVDEARSVPEISCSVVWWYCRAARSCSKEPTCVAELCVLMNNYLESLVSLTILIMTRKFDYRMNPTGDECFHAARRLNGGYTK